MLCTVGDRRHSVAAGSRTGAGTGAATGNGASFVGATEDRPELIGREHRADVDRRIGQSSS